MHEVAGTPPRAAGPYNAKCALYEAYPEMAAYASSIADDLRGLASELASREEAGVDTSFARTRMLEVRWRVSATGDVGGADGAMRRLRDAIGCSDPPNASMQDHEGSFAPGTELFFLQLDRSTDQLLAREWPWKIAPYFLERIDDPVRAYTYLEDLAWCDVRRRGVDTRKELNLSVSVIARLAMRGGQGGYLSSPGMIPTLESFARSWRDRDTGFYGVKYVTDDRGDEVTTKDLSLTFHMVRYLPHLVEDWPTLVETLLAIADDPYPQGRVDGGTKVYSDHNNYDVAEILRRGWRRMRPSQRVRASELIDGMLRWCLAHSVSPDGKVMDPDPSDMVPDAYYFCAAFLDTVGFFDRRKRFWTDKDLGDAILVRNIQTGMAANLARFNPRLTVVADARERLDIQRRPTSTAVL